MGYGILIKNDNEETIIDSTYRNFSLHGYGNASCTANTLTTVNLTGSTSNNVFAAISPTTSGFAFVESYVMSGSNITGFRIGSDTTMTVPYAYYINDLKNSTSSGYGIKVMDASGNVVFCSNEDGYFDIVNKYDGWYDSTVPPVDPTPPSNLSSYYGDFTVDDAVNNYFCTSGMQVFVEWKSGQSQWYHSRLGLKRIGSTTIRMGYCLYQITSTSQSGYGRISHQSQSGIEQLLEIKKPGII